MIFRMAINLGAIAKTLRAEEKVLERQLGKVRKALTAFIGLDGRGNGKKRSRHSAKSRAAISKAQKARWRKVRAATRLKSAKKASAAA